METKIAYRLYGLIIFALTFTFLPLSSSVAAPTDEFMSLQIEVGRSPWGMAFSPDQSKLYVANYGDGTLSVVDVALGIEIDTITVGDSPTSVVVSSNGLLAYVTNSAGNSVSVIDLQLNQETLKIPTSGGPVSIALTPDNKRAYVTNQGSELVEIIDLDTNQIIDSLPIAKAFYKVAITPDGARALVTSNETGTIYVIDTTINEKIDSITLGGSPFDIAISADGSKAYVTNLGDTNLAVVNLNDYSVEKIPLGFQASGITITSDGTKAYINSLNLGNVQVLDLASKTLSSTPVNVGPFPIQIVATTDGSKVFASLYLGTSLAVVTDSKLIQQWTIPGGGQRYFLALSPNEEDLYVSNLDGTKLTAIDLLEETITEIELGQPSGALAISPDGNELYVSLADQSMAIVDLSSNQIVETIPINGISWGMALTADGSKAYAAHMWESAVSVIDLDSRQVISTIRVGESPFGMTITPDSSKVYVANSNDNTVSVIDVASDTVVSTIELPNSPLFLDVNPEGTKVFVTLSNISQVGVIDVASNTLVDRFRVNEYPVGIDVGASGNRAYISDYEFSNISLLDIGTSRIIGRVNTGLGPVGVLTNASETQLYVASEVGTITVIWMAYANIPSPSQQPKGSTSGERLSVQPVILIADSFTGERKPFNGEVVASISSGIGTLSGTTRINAVNGVATFTDLRITGTGEFVLKFKPKGVPAVFSKSFRVSEPAPQITYRVIYQDNSSGSTQLPVDYNALVFGQKFEISSQEPKRVGYTFTGWNTSAAGTGTSYAPGSSVTSGSSQLVLYPIWKINQYSLTLSANGKSNEALDLITANFATSMKIPTVSESKLPAGYQLTSWNTAADGSGRSYTQNDEFVFGAADVTLYAQWKTNSYKVSYDGNGSTIGKVPQSVSQLFNSSVTTSAPIRTLSKRGYTFGGWNTKKDGSGTNYKIGESFLLGATNLTLYANWIPNTYKVTYRSVSATPIPSGEFTTGGSIATAPTTPTRSGYVFKGWSDRPAKDNIITFPYAPTGKRNISLYAVWEKKG